MREIKFRAWNTRVNKMAHFDLGWHIENIDEEGLRFSGDAGKFRSKDLDAFILMQYTGLSDRRGKEIYEGDILAIQYAWGLEKLEVKWSRHGFAVQDGWGDWFPSQEQSEVIGNIYENGNLLNGK